MNTDRNLLFAVLALQADLIDHNQFVDACSAWAGRKETPLADILLERGWLSTADRSDVERLLERKLRKHGGDVHKSLAELTSDDLRQSIVACGLGEPEPGGQSTTAYTPETRDRYTLTRLHATGGLGRVWLARDDSLGRDVALKDVRPEIARRPEVWGRFLQEAKITGQLEHPGIVPIYELSRKPDSGDPFYTMRFVQGRTLADAIESHQQATTHLGESVPDNRRRTRASLAHTPETTLRDLLTAFIGVCNAVAFAHSKGIIHRDLKPQNVVLGDYGEVIVLDWGLAKSLLDQVAVTTDSSGEEIVELGIEQMTTDAEPHTLEGQVLGTPAYMAPEQADGKLELLTERTDVYGLGAILYQILTGKAPFDGRGGQEVLRNVRHRNPKPPRQVARQTPPALEAICLRALSKDPDDRYASTMDLAREVQRWLSDEPVAAYADPLLTRLARWGRRHRTSVAAGIVLLLAAVGFLSLLSVLMKYERDRTDVARAEAVSSRDDLNAALYVNRIALADRERQGNNFRQSERLLDLCPPALRRWEWDYLKRQCNGVWRAVPSSGEPINELATSPDGKWIASGSGHTDQPGSAGVITIWDPKTLKPVRSLYGMANAVDHLCFSSDGRYLAAAGHNVNVLQVRHNTTAGLIEASTCEARVFDLATGRTLLHLPDHSCLGFAPGGTTVAAARRTDPTVRVWDWQTKQERFRIRPVDGIVTCVRFSPDGRWLTTCSMRKDFTQLRQGGSEADSLGLTLQIWDAEKGALVHTRDRAGPNDFSPDGRYLAMALLDRSIVVRDLVKQRDQFELRGHQHLPNHVKFDPQGQRLLSASLDRTAKVWDAATGRELVTLRGHAGMLSAAIFVPGGQEVLTADHSGALKAWSISSDPQGQRLLGHTGYVTSLGFSVNNYWLVSAGLDGVRFWDRTKGTESSFVKEASELVAVSADGQRAATSLRNNQIRIHDMSRPGRPGEIPPEVTTIRDHSGRIRALALNATGRYLASTSISSENELVPGPVLISDATTGQTLQRLSGFTDAVIALAWHPDGQQLATFTIGGQLQVWNALAGEQLRNWVHPVELSQRGPVALFQLSLAYSPDGRMLASAHSGDRNSEGINEIVLWDQSTGAPIRRLSGHTAGVGSLAFNRDSSRLASASWNLNLGAVGEVKLWDLVQGVEVLTLPGYGAVAFSGDGAFLAAGSGEALGPSGVKVWDGRPAAAADTLPAANGPAEPGLTWESIIHAEGGFSMLFPGLPRLLSQVQTPGGRTVSWSILISSHPPGTDYTATFVNQPLMAGDPEAFLDHWRDLATAELGGKVLKESRLKHAGVPCRDVTMTVLGGTMVHRVRCYVAKNKTIHVGVTAPSASPADPAIVEKFFESFRLLTE